MFSETVQQIAEIVGQVGVESADEPFLAEIRVPPGGDVAHQVIAQCLDAVAVSQFVGVNTVAQAFTQLEAADIPPTVDEERRNLVVGKPQRVQHDSASKRRAPE